MDLAVASPFILAIASALAFVAYKHPKGYDRIFFILSYMVALGGFAVGGWNFGLGAAYHAVETLVPPSSVKVVQQAIDSRATPLWIMWTMFLGAIYINFLAWLPTILKDE